VLGPRLLGLLGLAFRGRLGGFGLFHGHLILALDGGLLFGSSLGVGFSGRLLGRGGSGLSGSLLGFFLCLGLLFSGLGLLLLAVLAFSGLLRGSRFTRPSASRNRSTRSVGSAPCDSQCFTRSVSMLMRSAESRGSSGL